MAADTVARRAPPGHVCSRALRRMPSQRPGRVGAGRSRTARSGPVPSAPPPAPPPLRPRRASVTSRRCGAQARPRGGGAWAGRTRACADEGGKHACRSGPGPNPAGRRVTAQRCENVAQRHPGTRRGRSHGGNGLRSPGFKRSSVASCLPPNLTRSQERSGLGAPRCSHRRARCSLVVGA